MYFIIQYNTATSYEPVILKMSRLEINLYIIL